MIELAHLLIQLEGGVGKKRFGGAATMRHSSEEPN